MYSEYDKEVAPKKNLRFKRNYRHSSKKNQREEQFRIKTNAKVAQQHREEINRQLSGDVQYRIKPTEIPASQRAAQNERAIAARNRLRANNERNVAAKEEFRSRNSDALDALQTALTDVTLSDKTGTLPVTSSHTVRYPGGSLLTIPLLTRSAAPTNIQQPTVPMMLDHFMTARLIQDLTDSPDDIFLLNDTEAKQFWTERVDSIPFSTAVTACCFKTSSHESTPTLRLRPLKPDSVIAKESIFETSNEHDEHSIPGTRLVNKINEIEQELRAELVKAKVPFDEPCARKRAKLEIDKVITASQAHTMHIPGYLYYASDARLLTFLQFCDETYLRNHPELVDQVIDRGKLITGFTGEVTSIRLWDFYAHYPGRTFLNHKDLVLMNQIFSEYELTPDRARGLTDPCLSINHALLTALLKQFGKDLSLYQLNVHRCLNQASEQKVLFINEQQVSGHQAWMDNSLFCQIKEVWLNKNIHPYCGLPLAIPDSSSRACLRQIAMLFACHNITGLVADDVLANIGASAVPAGCQRHVGSRETYVSQLFDRL